MPINSQGIKGLAERDRLITVDGFGREPVMNSIAEE